MDANTSFARSFVAALGRTGMKHAAIAPGSRNTPLSIALADSVIEDSTHHDERSASFFAIGMAKHTGRPVAIVTTSGTAATELHPAIAEADASGVPIVAITADRPSDLIGRAAPQTIDQRALFGGMVRHLADIDVDETTTDGVAVARDAMSAALGRRPGPVHVNLRFQEPLVIGDADPPSPPDEEIARAPMQPDSQDLEQARAVLSRRRGIVVAGPEAWRGGAGSIAALGRSRGWPVLADPLSGLRTGLTDVEGVLGSDLLSSAGWLDLAPPEAIVRFGRPPTSKALNSWMTAHPEVPQVVVAPWGAPDPGRSASMILAADPGPAAEALADDAEPDPAWSGRWVDAQRAASEAALIAIADNGFPTEPAVVSTIAAALGAERAMWIGSSMPIRDVDSYFPVTSRPITLHGHRGANGIDGLISAAAGTAAAGVPTIALVGDVAMLHDIGSLATLRRTGLPVTVIVINNDGGGIFHFLPQAGHRHFERHFGTPHGLSFSSIAEGFGIEGAVAASARDLEAAVTAPADAPRLLEICTDRIENVAVHRRIAGAVVAALEGSTR